MAEITTLDEQRAGLGMDIASGESIEVAAARNGYSTAGAYVALDTPILAAAIIRGMARRITLEGAPAAIRYLVSLVKDESADKRLRLDAAKTLLDRAGFVAPKVAESERPGDKGLHDMSSDELRAFIGRARSELANRAPVIDSAPNGAPAAGEAADIFD